jgi:hypothetical protein
MYWKNPWNFRILHQSSEAKFILALESTRASFLHKNIFKSPVKKVVPLLGIDSAYEFKVFPVLSAGILRTAPLIALCAGGDALYFEWQRDPGIL